MDPAIPAHLKKYIKKARATRVKENKISYKSPKQVAKQNQIVIIGNTSGRRRPYTKRGGGKGEGGGGDYPRIVYIPQSIPNMSIPMSNPQEIRQPIPPSIHGFQAQPVYRNPFRMEPFRTALNPPPFTENKPLAHTADKSIFTAPPSPPPPLEPNIVQEPNFLDIRAMPIATVNPLNNNIDVIPPRSSSPEQEAFSPARLVPVTPIATELDLSRNVPTVNAFRVLPIMVNQPPNQGMTQYSAVNQLNSEVQQELEAYKDMGGYDAAAESERLRLAKQLSGGDYYSKNPEYSQRSGSESERPKYKKRGNIQDSGSESEALGGGGGERRRYTGRGYSKLTQDERFKLEVYFKSQLDPKFKNELKVSDMEMYKAGKDIFNRKKNNPQVVAIQQDVLDQFDKGKFA